MFYNPYETIQSGSMRWLKANFHVHAGVETKGECGELPMAAVIDAYVKAGYDVLAVTNHDTHVPYKGKRDDISLIDGYEYSPVDPHMVLIGANRIEGGDHQQAINCALTEGGFAVLCHPNWMHRDYWSLQKLEQTSGYTGIEIYNSLIYRLGGSGLALDKWDHLLTLGRIAFGFGNDDFHYWHDIDRVCNMIYAKSASYNDIKEAVASGRFYVSTGVVLDRFSYNGTKIMVKAKFPVETHIDTFHYRFIGTNGKLLHSITGTAAEFAVDEAERYIRVEVMGENGAMMYLQPILNDIFLHCNSE